MRLPRGAGLRRPVLAGAFVGCAYAALTAHRDHLATSHDANPFVPARGAASGGDSSWDTRAFAAERDALERETRTPPEKLTTMLACTRRGHEGRGAAQTKSRGSHTQRCYHKYLQITNMK